MYLLFNYTFHLAYLNIPTFQYIIIQKIPFILWIGSYFTSTCKSKWAKWALDMISALVIYYILTVEGNGL